jgi:WD40 repeat protein
MFHEDSVRGAIYLPDGSGGPRILSWSRDKTIRLWDAATGKPACKPMHHERDVRGAVYLPNAPGGPRILSWSEDDTVRLWDAVTAKAASKPMEREYLIWDR